MYIFVCVREREDIQVMHAPSQYIRWFIYWCIYSIYNFPATRLLPSWKGHNGCITNQANTTIQRTSDEVCCQRSEACFEWESEVHRLCSRYKNKHVRMLNGCEVKYQVRFCPWPHGLDVLWQKRCECCIWKNNSVGTPSICHDRGSWWNLISRSRRWWGWFFHVGWICRRRGWPRWWWWW